MVLPVDREDYGYRFYKNLNRDVKLKSDSMGRWDIDFDFEKDDWYNVTGFDSMVNACIIMIMTRYTELDFMSLYSDFGCRIHELIKSNKRNQIIYLIELYISEVLNSMRRVEKVNWVKVTDNPGGELYKYRVNFSITCITDDNDDDVGSVVEEEFVV